jgi:hypothetical protein
MDKYNMILESQLGPREGTLQLEDQDGVLKGTIGLLGFENPVTGQWTGEHSFRLSHHLRTLVSDLSCVSTLELEGNKIFGILRNDRNVMQWHGEKITRKEGGGKENGRA